MIFNSIIFDINFINIIISLIDRLQLSIKFRYLYLSINLMIISVKNTLSKSL